MKYMLIATCFFGLTGCSAASNSIPTTQKECIQDPCKINENKEFVRFIIGIQEGEENEKTLQNGKIVKEYLLKQPNVKVLPETANQDQLDFVPWFFLIETTPEQAKKLEHPLIKYVEQDHVISIDDPT